MPRAKKRLGVGAECNTALKYLHPRQLVTEKFPNATAAERIQNLIAIRKEKKRVNRREQEVIVFNSEKFENQEVHCVVRWVKVDTEGPDSEFFDEDDGDGEEEVQNGPEGEGSGTPIPAQVLELATHRITNEDVANVRAMGFGVDDDNEPAPENIPVEDDEPEVEENGLMEGQEWGWGGFCNRKKEGGVREKAKLIGVSEVMLGGLDLVKMFLIFFPRVWFEQTVVKQLKKVDGLHNVEFGEMLRWIGIWLLLSTTVRLDRKKFWSTAAVDRESGAPFRLNDLMLNKRFETILQNIMYTDVDPPQYKDRFWEVRQMIDEWNKNMAEKFSPSWVSCLDESMSIWFNKWTCPGWMFVPCKPHPFGNEYHSVCCGETSIMWGIELVEGKDSPPERPADPNVSTFGKTTALLLRMLAPIFGTAKVVILDSGFCVLKALLKLRDNGVYGSAVIKKRRYWPAGVPGEAIDLHCAFMEVGKTDSVRGETDGVKYDIFCMKEPVYTMKLMSTYSGLVDPPSTYEVHRHYIANNIEINKSFKLQEPLANHYLYRHVVDNHNNGRNALPSIEDTWGTHRWPNRVFAFILAISEINSWLAFRHFVWKETKYELVDFRKRLAFALIRNEYLQEEIEKESREKRKFQGEHKIVTAPCYCGKFERGEWVKNCKQAYQNYPCRTPKCKKRIRTMCSCDLGVWMCADCHVLHVLDTMKSDCI